MSFILYQIKQIRHGGPELRRKIRIFPSWCLWWFATGKYSSRMAYYVLRIAVAIKPNCAEAHALLAGTLISLGRFDEAFAAWEQSFLLKPTWSYSCNRVWTGFLVCGQNWAIGSIKQRYIDAQNDFASKHQLDKLGVRFLMEFSLFIGSIGLLDTYVKMDILGRRSTARPIVLADKPANKCYLDYWRRYLPDMITDPLAIKLLSPLAKYLEDQLGAVMDSSGKQVYAFHTWQRAVQEQWESEGRGPLLTLTKSDHERGWECLQALGVPPEAWFVGLHVRDDTGIGNPANCVRNSDITTYRLAIESIVARGGWVIRMGDPSMKPLPPMSHVIDYIHSEFRSDWMDVFLWARCRFFIGTNSGPIVVPPTFGVPCVITNWTSLGLRPWFNKDLLIFKLNWSKSEARYLNFKEVISSALGLIESNEYLASVGVRLVDNTPEEINDVVVEMMDKLDGKIVYSKGDEELQERFNKLYINNHRMANARIGRDFLRKWEHLL